MQDFNYREAAPIQQERITKDADRNKGNFSIVWHSNVLFGKANAEITCWNNTNKTPKLSVAVIESNKNEAMVFSNVMIL